MKELKLIDLKDSSNQELYSYKVSFWDEDDYKVFVVNNHLILYSREKLLDGSYLANQLARIFHHSGQNSIFPEFFPIISLFFRFRLHFDQFPETQTHLPLTPFFIYVPGTALLPLNCCSNCGMPD